MLSSHRLLAAKSVAKAPSTAPVLSPAVVRSLYRRLFREVRRLESDPVAKTLFPCPTELQGVMGMARPLYIPGTKNYLDELRAVFRDASKAPHVKLAFDTLNRLRAHDENIKSKLPGLLKDRDALMRSLQAEAPKHAALFRAAPLPMTSHSGPQYVPATPNVPSKVVLRDRASVELAPGTVLLAHPLSSTHVDRRVMIITERTPAMTSGLVLDLQFIFPISRGNPMFPEVFWGHEVYDGGFNQINLTMPPTAQVVILHTLEPPTEADEADMRRASGGAAPATAQDYVSSWLKWGSTTAGAADSAAAAKEDGKDTPAAAAAAAAAPGGRTAARRRAMTLTRQHELLCQTLIKSAAAVTAGGAPEPTLYVSKVEALPYLARLAAARPRSSLRMYWGSMRWMTSQIEVEVGNGHWFPVEVSPSFFSSYDLSPKDDLKESLRRSSAADRGAPADVSRFPSAADVAAAKTLRERRFGADVALPQVFPAEGAIRRRECLWDEIMYALGGEYAALVGGCNPFVLAGAQRNSPQILAPLLPGSSASAAVAADSDDDADMEEFSLDDEDLEAIISDHLEGAGREDDDAEVWDAGHAEDIDPEGAVTGPADAGKKDPPL